jgi:hypothetical protein
LGKIDVKPAKERTITPKELANNLMQYIFLNSPIENYLKDKSQEVKELSYELLNLMIYLDICIEKEKGSILHLPFKGSVEEQPSRRFRLFLDLRSAWISQINSMRNQNGKGVHVR